MPNGTVAGSTTPRRATALVLVAAAALCVLAYANTLSNGFVYDDFEAIVQNPIVHGPLDLGKFLRTPYPCEDIGKTSYRPLTILTYWIDQRIGGGAPWAFHLTNLLWHTLATLAFGALAAGIFGRGRIAATATLLFAVHPVHTEAVAWAVGRAEVISSALGFAALALALARVEGRRRVAAGALGAALFGIALLAKESVVTAPLLAFLLLAWRRRTDGRAPGDPTTDRRDPGRFLLPLAFCAVLGAYVALRLSVLGMMTTETRLFALNKVTTLDRVVTMIEVLGDYVRLQVFPSPLVGDYAYNFNPALLKHRTLDLPVLAAGLALGAAVLGMGVGWWRRHPTAPALAWFLIALTPYSNLVLQFAQVKTERLLYWPSAGSCMALAWLLARLDAPAAAGRASSRLARCLTPAVLGVFLVLTAVRNRDWRDGLTFFADVVEKQPLNPMGHAGLGAELIAAGRAEEGVGSALEALRLRPDFVHGRIVLAQGLEALGRPGEAADALAPAVTLDLTPRAVVYLTTLLGAAGRVDEAQAAGAEALTRFPGNPDATLALALIELGSGAAESARARLDPVIARYPGHAPARYHRGLALRMLGRTEEAIGDFDAALALDPALAPARLERSRLRVVTGVEVAAAVAELRQLVAGRPPFLAEAYAALVAGLRRLGDDAGARRVEAEAADAARMSASGAGS